jgi:hypothetical protein
VVLNEDGSIRWPPKERLDSALNDDEKEMRGYESKNIVFELSGRIVEPDLERLAKKFEYVKRARQAKEKEEEEEEEEEEDGDEQVDEEDAAGGDEEQQWQGAEDDDADEDEDIEDDAGPAASDESESDEDASTGKAAQASPSVPLSRMISSGSHASAKSDAIDVKKRAPAAIATPPTKKAKVSSGSSNISSSGERRSVIPHNSEADKNFQTVFKNVVRPVLDARLAEKAYIKRIADKRAERRQAASVTLTRCITETIARFNTAKPDKQIKMRGEEDKRVSLLCQCLEYLLKEASGMGRVPDSDKDTALPVYERKLESLCSAMARDAGFQIVGDDEGALINYNFNDIRDAMKRLVKTEGKGKGLDDKRFGVRKELGKKIDMSAKQLFEAQRTWNVAQSKRFGL